MISSKSLQVPYHHYFNKGGTGTALLGQFPPSHPPVPTAANIPEATSLHLQVITDFLKCAFLALIVGLH